MLSRLLDWSEGDDIHGRLLLSLAQDNTLVISETDLPDLITLIAQLPDKFSRLEVPQLDLAVIASCDDESIVKLKASDGIVVCHQLAEHLV